MATITSNPPSPSPSTLSSSSGSGFSTSSNSTSSSSSSMSATSVTSSAPSTAVAYNGPTRVRFDNACVLIPQKCKNKFLGKGVVIPSFLAPTAGNRRARTQSHTHKTCLRTPSPAPPSPCSLASPSSPTPPSSFPSLPPSTSPKPKFARIVRSASFSILFPSPASDDKRIPLRACCPDCVTPTEEAHLIEERFSEGARWLRQGESPCLELGPLPVIPLMPVLEKEKPQADEDEDDLFPLPSPRKCQPPDEDDAFPLPRSRADKRKSVILGAGLPLRGGKEPEDRLAEGAGLVRRTSAVKRCDSPLSFEDNAPPPADAQSTALIPASKPIPTIVVRPGSSHSHRHKRSMSDSHIRTGGLRPDSCAHVERQCEVHAHKRKPKKVFAGFKWL